nr:hypothetical protein CFP56_70945 [Quercus suber]
MLVSWFSLWSMTVMALCCWGTGVSSPLLPVAPQPRSFRNNSLSLTQRLISDSSRFLKQATLYKQESMMTFYKLELILILWSQLTMKQSKQWIFLVTQKIQMKARICLGPLYIVKHVLQLEMVLAVVEGN